MIECIPRHKTDGKLTDEELERRNSCLIIPEHLAAQKTRTWKLENRKLRIPDVCDKAEVAELRKRLQRKRSSDPKQEEEGEARDYENGCEVCGCMDESHDYWDCPWLYKLPKNRTVVGPSYDIVCMGCGQLGELCCSKRGSKRGYAILKACGGCHQSGHWSWECPSEIPGLREEAEQLRQDEVDDDDDDEDEVDDDVLKGLWNDLMEDNDEDVLKDVTKDDKDVMKEVEEEEGGDQGRQLIIPEHLADKFAAQKTGKWKWENRKLRLPRDKAEVADLRNRLLRKRSSDPKQEEEGEARDYEHGCEVCMGCGCMDESHDYWDCPWLDKLPKNRTVVGPSYDIVCMGCGQLGELCCSKRGSKRGYAILKACGGCHQSGHWSWECPSEIPGLMEEVREEVPSSEPSSKVSWFSQNYMLGRCSKAVIKKPLESSCGNLVVISDANKLANILLKLNTA